MFKKILLPTDGSEISEKAAEAGLQLASTLSAEVVVLYVTQPVAAPMGFDGMAAAYAAPDPELDAEAQKHAEAYLARIEAMARAHAVPCSTRLVSNFNVADGVAQAAQDAGCDLIFMASHGRSGLSRLLLGSVTTKVVSIATVPVLVYRT